MRRTASSVVDYRKVTLQRLQLTATEMGVTAVLGSGISLLARLLIPTPEYVWLRLLLLPLTAVFAYIIVRAPTIRTYGFACIATIASVSFNSYLGALGTDRPMIYFLPAATIIVLATSFFWVTLGQWFGGVVACYFFFLPFILDQTASRTDSVFSLLFAALALITSFVSHLRIQDYQQRAFDQQCRLEELSITDALTGARTRFEFLQQAEKAAILAHRSCSPLTLLYLDIDHFKRLNDAHGHAAGDAVLRDMSAVIHKALRKTDVFGRLGGEEFCVLLPNQSEDDGRRLAVHLRGLLALVLRPDGPLTVSVGIARMRNGETVSQTVHRADLAMFKAKHSGRDTVCTADEHETG